MPEPLTDELELDACAEPVPEPEVWLGLFRDVPREPVAAWAIDCEEEEALDISQPDSARAWLLRTLEDEALLEETCGENELLEFAAATVPEMFALFAGALEALAAEDALGALRAELLLPVADWAIDCAVA